MRLAIVGSRTFNDYEYLVKALHTLVQCSGFSFTEVVSGGARGADSLAETYAQYHGIPLKIFPAEWDKYGKSAGYRRNELIVKECDVLVAFWDGVSRGTKHSIDLAVKYNKPVFKFTDWKENE